MVLTDATSYLSHTILSNPISHLFLTLLILFSLFSFSPSFLPPLQVSPQKTPQVVGKLLDLECAEDFIR